MPAGQIHSLTPPPPTGYVTSGLILHLDAIWNTNAGPNSGATIWNDLSGNGNNFTLLGAPTIGPEGIVFNTIDRYAQSINNVQLVGYDAITVEARFRPIRFSQEFWVFENSTNYNIHRGAIGVSGNTNGFILIPNEFHIVHNILASIDGARDFISETNDGATHTGSHTFSSVPNPNGRLSYHNGALQTFIPSRDFSTSTDNFGQFLDAQFYIARRAPPHTWAAGNLVMQSFRIYNRQLSPAEICQNAWADYNRFGGAVPGC
jgi:hypothetical protein